MIDYIAESQLCATVKVSGNLQRTLGIALSYFHREHSQKIARYEASPALPEGRYAVPLLKAEIQEFEHFMRDLEALMAVHRREAAEDSGHG